MSTDPMELAVNWWQAQVEERGGNWHPLTCGNNSRHTPLIYKNGILVCEDCEYKQQIIPSVVLEAWEDSLKKEECWQRCDSCGGSGISEVPWTDQDGYTEIEMECVECMGTGGWWRK